MGVNFNILSGDAPVAVLLFVCDRLRKIVHPISPTGLCDCLPTLCYYCTTRHTCTDAPWYLWLGECVACGLHRQLDWRMFPSLAVLKLQSIRFFCTAQMALRHWPTPCLLSNISKWPMPLGACGARGWLTATLPVTSPRSIKNVDKTLQQNLCIPSMVFLMRV